MINFPLLYSTLLLSALAVPNDAPLQVPVEVGSLRDLSDPVYHNRKTIIKGRIADVFRDKSDSQYCFFILKDADASVLCSLHHTNAYQILSRSVGSTLKAIGSCRHTMDFPYRKFSDTEIQIQQPSDFSISQDAPDPFDVPDASTIVDRRPTVVTSLGARRVTGQVIAVWNGDRILIRDSCGMLVGIRTKLTTLPTAGEIIEAVGRPETDTYILKLDRAIWRPSDAECPPAANVPDEVSVDDVLYDKSHAFAYQVRHQGSVIKTSGIVRSIGHIGERTFFSMESDSVIFTVNLSAAPEAANRLQIGCIAEVTGICVFDIDNWHPSVPFPQINDFSVVVRRDGDVRVLANPPWWTPGKLMVVVAGIFILMLGSILLNLVLRRIISAKSHQLKAEISARLGSDLKTRERTRLAVELHDSIAQSLSGAAMEIGSAIKLSAEDKAGMLTHLDIASKTLRSCRDELRDCLWDLRSQALEVGEMNSAIRTTLIPYVSDAALVIRFNVPRERLSDNTAYALFRIIRELVSNAVRHGKARTVRIAGSLDGNHLLFSVQDDGSGFDPKNRPGIEQGHFGLDGVRERIRRQGGDMTIKSAPDKGTKISMSLDITSPEDECLQTL